METIQNEVWKPVSGFPRYEVSDMGRVRGTKTLKNGKKVRYILKPVIPTYQAKKSNSKRTYKKYAQQTLYNQGKPKVILLHCIVAAAFLGPKPKGFVTDHKNGDMYDNRAQNLQYLTNRSNLIKGVKQNRTVSCRYQYKIIDKELFCFSYQTFSIADVSLRIGVPRSTIYHAIYKIGWYENLSVIVTRERL